MADLLFLLVFVAFFASAAALVRLCDRIVGTGDADVDADVDTDLVDRVAA
jgi:hypothetical protein